MRNVIDFAPHREARPIALPIASPLAPPASYRDVMAALRGLHRVRGFRSDPWIRHSLRRTYDQLVERARTIAPSPAKFAADIRALEQVKAG